MFKTHALIALTLLAGTALPLAQARDAASGLATGIRKPDPPAAKSETKAVKGPDAQPGAPAYYRIELESVKGSATPPNSLTYQKIESATSRDATKK